MTPQPTRELARCCLAGTSVEADRLRAQVVRLGAARRSTVLLQGPLGCRKDLVARAIHDASELSAEPFQEASPGDLPTQFTRGTFFLREVVGLTPTAQTALAELLARRNAPLDGQNAPERVIVATRHNLEAEVEAGRLGEDLFYRLNVLTLDVPPLRRRVEDLPEIARRMLNAQATDLGVEEPQLTPEALRMLAGHDWPGNLRELESVVTRALLVAQGEPLSPHHLFPPEPGRSREAVVELHPNGFTLRALEERWIRVILDQEGGNRSQTARVLGINRATLYNKLKLYGIA